MAGMTKKAILGRLVAIATHQGSHRDPFICCDLVVQEELFDIQEKLSQLMLDLATDIGPESEDMLCTRMPYAFSKE